MCRKNASRASGRRLRNVLPYLHKLVVVDPDQVVGLRSLFYGVRELAIHSLVKLPIPGIEIAARLQIMEERPYDLVRKAFIEVALLLLRQEERRVLVGVIAARTFEDLADFRRVFSATRAHPNTAVRFEQRLQCAHQATTAGLPLELPMLRVDSDGDTVGDQNQLGTRWVHRGASTTADAAEV